MVSLLFRNLIFTILQPGLVVGLIPYLLIQRTSNLEWNFNELNHLLGGIIFLIGFAILLLCVFRFATEGKGTISPADRTKELVIKGLYRFSRNPMYVGIILILIGQTIFVKSIYLLIYTILVFISFHIFIKYIEEPRLKRDFKDDYELYIRKVRRWL